MRLTSSANGWINRSLKPILSHDAFDAFDIPSIARCEITAPLSFYGNRPGAATRSRRIARGNIWRAVLPVVHRIVRRWNLWFVDFRFRGYRFRFFLFEIWNLLGGSFR